MAQLGGKYVQLLKELHEQKQRASSSAEDRSQAADAQVQQLKAELQHQQQQTQQVKQHMSSISMLLLQKRDLRPTT